MKKALLLGAGLVSKPLVQYLLKHGIQVTVASRTLDKAAALLDQHPNGRAVAWVVEEADRLRQMVAEHDVVISLLPWIYHLQVANACIEAGKHMITTSYVKPEMKALDAQVRAKGLCFLNEIGLDPGIDHMSAMKMIHDIQHRGGTVTVFNSYCGALPGPDNLDNPLKYKFSWSPRGVVLAGRNTAMYRKDGQVVNIASENLFDDHHPLPIEGVGQMEFYPNRDSISYIDIYNLPEIRTMFRGTIRFPGWCEVWSVVSKSGWLSLDPLDTAGLTHKALTARLAGLAESDVKAAFARKFKLEQKPQIMEKLEYMGLFLDTPINKGQYPPLDVLTDYLLPKMSYAKGQRDMVVMLHEVIGEFPDGHKERFTSQMVDFGVEGVETAVARTVALPAAIATRLLLEGKIRATGVLIPVDPAIYLPVLEELENTGIRFTEKVDKI